MKRPFLQDDAFLADVATASRPSAANPPIATLHVWWLGQSGFLVRWAGRSLLLDPYLSDSLTRKYSQTDKPHIRMTERVIAPERLDFIDLVTSSHGHTDHLDAETLRPLAKANPQLVLICPESNRLTARERSGLPDDRIIGLDAALPAAADQPPFSNLKSQISNFTLTAIPAAHESLDRDAVGRLLYLGLVVRAGPFTIYHSGDTVLYQGMVDLLRPHRVDLALLPINGRAAERRVAGNLSGSEAAQLAKDIGARLVVPCHYDMFEFNTANPDDLVTGCRRLDQACRVLQQGERLSLRG